MSEDHPHPRLSERLTRACRGARALSEVLWEALEEELADPHPEHVAELSERLGEVAAVVSSLASVGARARGELASAQAYSDSSLGEPSRSRESPARAYGDGSSGERAESRESPARAYSDGLPGERVGSRESPPRARTPPVPAELIDELAPARPSPALWSSPESPRGREMPPPGGAPPARRDFGERPREGDEPRKARPQIEIRDERSTEGPAAWIDSIGRRLERYEQDGAPFAVLLVELADLERLRQAEAAEELSRLIDLLEDVLARALRPADTLTRERPGRYWLLAPQTDGPGAHALVERIADAVRSSVSHRGAPLEVAAGVSVCPGDGRRASELAAHADVGLYAARAAGRPSIG